MEIINQALTFGSAKRSLVETAALIAIVAHEGQRRKDGGAAPYIVHPFMVSRLLTKYGFDDVTVAASLVHDVLEDTAVTQDQLTELLGQEVVDLVLPLTEDKQLPWEDRKQAYQESVRRASDQVKAISIADKIHNLESLLSAYEAEGPSMWKAFSRGRDAKVQVERSLLAMFQKAFNHPLVEGYANLVARLDNVSGD